MAFLLRHIARYAAQKLAADPQVRETAAKAARVVVDEAKHIAMSPASYITGGKLVLGQDLSQARF